MHENSKESFKFSTPAGWDLCRKILSKKLPFCPHDYQLDGVAVILDGKDFIGLSATGSGKSAYVYMTMHVVLAILEDLSLCPAAKFPQNPAILVIYPTTAPEEDQVSNNIMTLIIAPAVKVLRPLKKCCITAVICIFVARVTLIDIGRAVTERLVGRHSFAMSDISWEV